MSWWPFVSNEHVSSGQKRLLTYILGLVENMEESWVFSVQVRGGYRVLANNFTPKEYSRVSGYSQ